MGLQRVGHDPAINTFTFTFLSFCRIGVKEKTCYFQRIVGERKGQCKTSHHPVSHSRCFTHLLSCHFPSFFSQHTLHNVTAFCCLLLEWCGHLRVYVSVWKSYHLLFDFWGVSRAGFQSMSLHLCWLAFLEGCCVFYFLNNSPTHCPLFASVLFS